MSSCTASITSVLSLCSVFGILAVFPAALTGQSAKLVADINKLPLNLGSFPTISRRFH